MTPATTDLPEAKAAAERGGAAGVEDASPPPTGSVERGLLRSYLANRDVPCPGCRYNLRALRGDRCPECGEAIVLRVHLAEPRLAVFLLGLIPLTMSLGFGGLLTLLAMLVTALQRGGPSASLYPHFFQHFGPSPSFYGYFVQRGGPGPSFYGYFLMLTLMSLAGTVAWLRSRRRLGRLSLRWQHAWVWGCWAFAASGLIGAVFFID